MPQAGQELLARQEGAPRTQAVENSELKLLRVEIQTKGGGGDNIEEVTGMRQAEEGHPRLVLQLREGFKVCSLQDKVNLEADCLLGHSEKVFLPDLFLKLHAEDGHRGFQLDVNVAVQ